MALSLCSLPKSIEMTTSRQSRKNSLSVPPPGPDDAPVRDAPRADDSQADDPQARVRQRTVALLQALAPDEGYNLTVLPDVRLLRSNRPLKSVPVLYDPGIVIV